MANYCGECANLDIKGAAHYENEYYCKKTGQYCPKSKTACEAFIERPLGGYKPSGCYITTIICGILGLADDCFIMTSLRTLRDNFLVTFQDGINILKEYDQVGPKISQKVFEESKLFCADLLQRFLVPCSLSVKNGKYNEATTIYLNMCNELKEYFGLEDVQVDYNVQTPIDILGKGRTRQSIA